MSLKSNIFCNPGRTYPQSQVSLSARVDSLTPPSRSGAQRQELDSCSSLGNNSRQVASVPAPELVGKNLEFMHPSAFTCIQSFDQPLQIRMVTWIARILTFLMSGGYFKASHCQWWSRLFSIGQLVWEEDGSLSKTTKLLLLDSLLQEVCIESGSDGSLALSSLGLSVCLVSHNLLYSGLKKAHSTFKS